MLSNEVARDAQLHNTVRKAPDRAPNSEEIIERSQSTQKIDLLKLIMEARLDRLKNYKLT